MNRFSWRVQLISIKPLLTCLIICSALIFISSAKSSEITNTQAWEPPPPASDGFDWIQLSSNEWLKGSLKVLYENNLEFDSDKLDFQEFEWKDVKQIRGHGLFRIRFEGPIIVVGLLHITERKVFITVNGKKEEFDRNQLVTITRGGSRRRNNWTSKIGLGLNISKGNTDQIQYNMKGTLKRRTLKTRFVFDYLGNFVSTDSINTTDNQRIISYFDIFKTRDYFYRLPHVEYYRDPFQNIKYRGTIGASIGYHLIDNSKTNWDIKAGPAYQFTRFESVAFGQDLNESTPAFTAGTSFDTELTDKLDFIANYNFNIVNKDSGLYVHHVITTLEAEITDLLDFDISFIWERTQKPALRSDGTIPRKDDLQLIFSVIIDF